MFWLITTFIIGYILIIAEHPLKINKTAPALIIGALCWTIYTAMTGNIEHVLEQLTEHTPDIAGILIFLMGAMTIVELIDLHHGFDIITNRITARSAPKLLWIVCGLTFFLSAILDNLTTTIVMVSMLRKLISDKEDRRFFAGMVVIAANSGGAFSPLGDVTTTMLWIGNRISVEHVIIELFIPSVVSLVVPLMYVSYLLKNKKVVPVESTVHEDKVKGSSFVFFMGVGVLICVPIFKIVTHLPPYMGMLLGLGILWLATEILHRKEQDFRKYSPAHALSRIDVPSILFFFGILAAVASLQSAGLLKSFAIWLDDTIGDKDLIIASIGVLSAVIDNVPLVAAAMGMYDPAIYPTDHKIWEFLAYAAGTGGSLLIIGSAAGIAAMGIEKIDFIWYLKKITFIALIGYVAGALAYLGMYSALNGGFLGSIL